MLFFFYPEGGSNRFLQTAGTFLPDYMVSQPRRQYLHIHCHKNFKSQIIEVFLSYSESLL
jgi:hypothetical protein